MRVWVLATLCMVLTGCGPKCLREHPEQVWVPKLCTDIYYPATIGDVTYMMYGGEDCTPAHFKTIWVCDQYEVEKATP